MGADLITIGYTVDGKKMKERKPYNPITMTDTGVQELITQYRPAILADLANIDYNGYLDAIEVDEFGNRDGEDVLASVLYSGWEVTASNYRNEDSYNIPGTDNVFIVAGGTSWGDDPFEGYSDLALLLAAVDRIPDLGQALGILGSGIKL